MDDDPGTRMPLRDWLGGHAGTTHDRANGRGMMAWSAAWAVAYVTATWQLGVSDLGPPGAWVMVALPVGLGIAVLVAYRRFLRDADEFTRTTQLEGAALGLGLGVVVLLSWGLLEPLGVAALSTPGAAAVLLVAWALGQVVPVRYR